MSEALQQFLADMNTELERCASEKVTRAMRLFLQCDEIYKGIVLMDFSGPLTATRLREHFDTLDLMDDLDNLIEDMEDEVKASPHRSDGGGA